MSERSDAKQKDLARTMEIVGLGFSVIFELVAGPFIGFLMGNYLVNHLGLHQWFMLAAVLIGFAAGAYNVTLTIRMMMKINQKKD